MKFESVKYKKIEKLNQNFISEKLRRHLKLSFVNYFINSLIFLFNIKNLILKVDCFINFNYNFDVINLHNQMETVFE